MKIKRLILLLLVLFAILPTILVCTVSMTRFRQRADSLIGENISAVTTLQAKNLEDFFAQRVTDLRSFSKLPGTLELLRQHESGEQEENYQDLLRESNMIFSTRRRDQEFVLRMTLFDSEGISIASSDEEFIGERSLLLETDWVRLRQNQVVVSDLRTSPRFHNDLPYFFIAHPIVANGEFSGAAVTAMDCSYFEKIVSQSDHFETETMTVMDSSGRIAASGEDSLKNTIYDIKVPNDLSGQWQAIDLSAAPTGSLRFEMDGKDKRGHYALIPSCGWTVLGSVEDSELSAPVRRSLLSTGWAAAALAVIFLIMLLLLNRQFYYPLNRLTESIRRMRQGDYSDRYVYNKKNELGEISTALGELMEAVQSKEEQLRESYRDLEALAANIPGGVHRCVVDEYGTFSFVSEGYLKLIGYTQSQLERVLHNRLYDTIYERDRDAAMKKLREQLKAGDTTEIEYRVVRSDGEIIWVFDKGRRVRGSGGEDWIYCVLLDITEAKKAQEELRQNEERLRIILNQAEDIIFEWNILEDYVTYSANWERKFNRPPVYHGLLEEAVAREDVHPEDAKAFTDLMTSVREGTPYGQAEVRLRCGEPSPERYIWCRIRVTAQFEEDGRVHKAVGVIIDIDSEKREAQKLLQKSQRDPLTKLYNRSTAYKLIGEILGRDSGPHAMVVIDIDNFKSVNDSMGHLFGDAVLTDIAARISGLCAPGEIASRIGGDEFLLFLPGIADAQSAEKRAQQFEGVLRHTFRTNFEEYRLSASLGVALAPEHGRGYTELFQNADTALYAAKKRGKDRFCLFSEEVRAETLRDNRGAGHVQTVMETRGGWNERLSDQIFKILYESKDTVNAVQLILEIVGRYYGVSRVYIFENSPDDRFCSNTYEWCADGIPSAKEKLQNIPYESLGDYPGNFNEEGVFYCGDIRSLHPDLYRILEPQGISSMLQCAILDGGKFGGYVGFDECAAARLWTKEEIDTLTLVAQIVSTFLLKRQAQNRLKQAYERQKSVMDNMDNWAYVVNQENYELLYLNQKTQLIAPNAKIGDRCYEAFFGGRKAPCQKCPLRELKEGESNCTMEIYNEVLKVWSSATASRLDWQDGIKAVLLCCNDITKYKEPEDKIKKAP